jgi:hypothetical protein
MNEIYDVAVVKEEEYSRGFTIEQAETLVRSKLLEHPGCCVILVKRIRVYQMAETIQVEDVGSGYKWLE